MLPFTFSLLKCTTCDFTKKLRLVPTKAHKIVPDNDFFRDVDEDVFEHLKVSFKGMEEEYKIEDDKRLFLFGNVIDEGKIYCDECKLYYPIEDSIVDFLNPVKIEKDEIQA